MCKGRLTGQGLWLLLALLAVGLLGSPAQGDEDADDQAERSFAREQLLRRAREGVDPGNREAGGLEELKKAVEARREALKGVSGDNQTAANEMLRRADLLMGHGEGAEGLIRQGAILYRWISGQLGEEKKVRLFYRSPKYPRGDSVEVPAKEAKVPPKPIDATEPKDPKAAKTPKAPTPEQVLEWHIDVERGADDTIALAGIKGLRAAARAGTLGALTGPEELGAFICQDFVDARQDQVNARILAFETDRPSRALVSAGTVAEKEQRAERFRETAKRFAALKEGVLASLDAMVEQERALKGAAGKLVPEIEEAKRKFAEASNPKRPESEHEEATDPKEPGEAEPEPKDEPEEKPKEAPKKEEPKPVVLTEAEAKVAAEASIDLELKRLQEILSEQQLRLLYIAVRRADLRLTLYDKALEQVKTESVAADHVYTAFENELTRMRRELQIDRLASEERRLKKLHTIAKAKIAGKDLADRRIWIAYEKALAELMAVNQDTTRVVKLRRRLERKANPEGAGVRATGEEAAVAADPDVILPDADYPEGCLPPEEVAPDPLRRFRNPSPATLDVNYIEDAEQAISFPEWDRSLAADHYDAVDDRIDGLKHGLVIAKDTAGLQRGFDKASAAAEAALQEVEKLKGSSSVYWEWNARVRRLRREVLTPDEAAFAETLMGIEITEQQIREDLVVYRGFREHLKHLGVRSFSIRVQRRLEGKRLKAAQDDLVSTIRRVGDWLTFNGEPHLGTFLKSSWLMVLACVGVLVGGILLVRFGRHGLDRVIRQSASKVPALRAVAVTVHSEEAQAKRTQAQGEAAAKAAEEAALAEVSKDEAGKAQKMGEGGYGGGAS